MFWPLAKKPRIYLDFAAGFRHAGAGFSLAKAGVGANPSSPHEEGRRSREQLEGARRKIASLIEVQADDVIFTSGATEANALAILGTVRARISSLQFPVSSLHALYLPGSHASVVENMKLLETEGVVVEPLPIKNAQVDCGALAKLLKPETVLVSMDAVCGETGVVWNTREVAGTLRAGAGKFESAPAARPIQLSNFPAPLLHVDASQAPLTEKITRAHFGADLLVFDASKVSTARGIGCLLTPYPLPLTPLYKGGGQERGLRSGSEAPELAAAFAAGLAAANSGREAFRSKSEQMRASLVREIVKAIPNVYINEGPKDSRGQAPHILNLSLPGRDTDYLVALLDEAGFAVSTRSACETDSLTGSRAVLELTADDERARSTLRVSWGPGVSLASLTRFAHALEEAVAFVDRDVPR